MFTNKSSGDSELSITTILTLIKQSAFVAQNCFAGVTAYCWSLAGYQPTQSQQASQRQFSSNAYAPPAHVRFDTPTVFDGDDLIGFDIDDYNGVAVEILPTEEEQMEVVLEFRRP